MVIIDDGDLIRGLGFVVIYSAYLEEAVDKCLDVFAAHDIGKACRLQRRPTSKKIEYMQLQLKELEPLSKELAMLPCLLRVVADLLEKRNIVIHGRVYAVPNVGDVRISSRTGAPETPANSVELYDLANKLFSARGSLLHASMFSLDRQFEAVRALGAGDPQYINVGFAPPISSSTLS